MTSDLRSPISDLIRRFIEDAGNLTSSFGMGRAIGQIFAYLYFSPAPRTLDDMVEDLGISKGSASTCVRQLEQWEAARKVWIKGDRKDYYEANEWLGRVVKNVLADSVGKRLVSGNVLLNGDAGSLPDDEETAKFIEQRIENLRRFQTRAQKMWNSPIVQMLLK